MSDFASLSSSPQRVRQANVAAALKAIFARGRLSRAVLARALGLNRSSSGHIVGDLTTSGLVREVADAAPKPVRAGRPGILLELVPEGAYFVGAEIGVEPLTALRINLLGSVIDCRVVPFEGRSAPVAEAVERAVALAFDGLSADEIERCEGFGLSAPAQMDRHGRVRIAPLLGWQHVDLARLTREALPAELPAMVENDANAFAFGETYTNRDGRRGVSLFLVIESRVGGGIVIDGQLFRGGNGLAWEIGHLHMPDAYGAELEETIGLGRLLSQYRGCGGGGETTLAGLLADVRDRAPAAVAIAEDWARNLAFALVQACRLVDPDRIVLGGSVAGLYPLISARVELHMEALQAESFPQPEIVVHRAAETGAAHGAACMLHQRFLSFGSNPAGDEPASAAPAVRRLPRG